MPLNFHIPLPGPFSWSTSISPAKNLRKAARSAAKAKQAAQEIRKPRKKRR